MSSHRYRARTKLLFLYLLFAAISTVINIFVQAIVGSLMHGFWSLYVGLAAGTLAGLVAKYLLDKRWIFRFSSRSRRHEARTFVVYGIFSGLTTIIFWASELGAFFLFKTDVAKYTGAVIGLAIGYTVKYWLDKKVTFIDNAQRKDEK